MRKAEYAKMFKKKTKAIDFIEELKLDIQYLTDVIENGRYKNQLDRNYKSADLEALKKMFKDIEQELNK
tara:strand:+ start:684 stop:890 length:207 start_codon:yes stop_codon:yes gene_type:complete